MELWDVYDINRNKTGKTAVRGEGLPEGGYHLVVHVCIIGSDGEVREEIGVTLDLNGVRPHYSVTYGEGFDDWYVVKADPDIESLELQYEEVQAVGWASEEEVLAMIDSGVFIPYFKGYISTIFNTADQYGSIRGK